MTQYRVGDKVRLIGHWWDDHHPFPVFDGAVKTVTGVKETADGTRLQFPGDPYFWYITEEFAVELVDETPAEPTLEQRVLRLEELLRTLYPGVEL